MSASVALLRDPDRLHLRFAYPGGPAEGPADRPAVRAQSVIAARVDRIRGRYDPNRGFPFGPP